MSEPHLRPESEIIFEDAKAEFDGETSDENFMGLATPGVCVGSPEDCCNMHWGGVRTVDSRYLDPLMYVSDGKVYVTNLGIKILKLGLQSLKDTTNGSGASP